MKDNKIRSLKSLMRRKESVARELQECEEQITNDYMALTQPVSNLVHSFQRNEYDGDLPFNGVYKFALNAKRVVDIVRLGASIYNDYRK